MSLLGTPVTLGQGDLHLPVFDVKAYTFRKKPRHYVAVKHKNALRIEPIIYLKTSILDENRQVVRDWDYLRFSMDRFRVQAQPKKKLMPEGKLFLAHPFLLLWFVFSLLLILSTHFCRNERRSYP